LIRGFLYSSELGRWFVLNKFCEESVIFTLLLVLNSDEFVLASFTKNRIWTFCCLVHGLNLVHLNRFWRTKLLYNRLLFDYKITLMGFHLFFKSFSALIEHSFTVGF
jgi:hypothetical protein